MMRMKAYMTTLMRAQHQEREAEAERADPVRAFLMRVLAAGEWRTALTAVPWCTEVAAVTVHDSYAAASARMRHAPAFDLVMKRWRRLLPPGSLRRIRKRQGPYRPVYYLFPELDEARAYFRQVTGVDPAPEDAA
jgi:hypothetical protein